jgi:hypothetical protein
VAETVLQSAAYTRWEGVVIATGPDVEVRNLGFGSSSRPAVSVDGEGNTVHVEDVVMAGAESYGLIATSGAHLSARSILIVDTQPKNTEIPGWFGGGFVPAFGATGEITRAVVLRSRHFGFWSCCGAQLRVADVAVRDLDSLVADDSAGVGFFCTDDALLHAERSVVQNVYGAGAVADARGRLELDDVVIQDIHDDRAGNGLGFGVVVENSGSLSASKLLVDEAETVGILHNSGEIAPVELRDVVIRRTRSASISGQAGLGLQLHAFAGSSFTERTDAQLERVLIEDSRWGAATLAGVKLAVNAVDLLIRDSTTSDIGVVGAGLFISEGASVNLERVEIDRATGTGFVLSGWPSIEGALSPAVALAPTVQVTDMLIRDTRSLPMTSVEAPGEMGRGIQVQVGTLVGNRVRLEGNREIGLMAFSADIELNNLHIVGTMPAQCADTCRIDAFGHGLVAGRNTSISVRQFAIEGSELCGVLLYDDPSLFLTDGQVSGSAIGACIQVDGYDDNRLSNGVVYFDNERNLDSTSLPVPDPAVSY